jgi:hypothetical protein
MNGQELRDRESAPVRTLFGGNGFIGYVFAGAGESLSGINAFLSGRKPYLYRDWIGGLLYG